jgi:hypothetical protein
MYVTQPCVRHGVDVTSAENFNRKSGKGNLNLHSRVILKWMIRKYNMNVG